MMDATPERHAMTTPVLALSLAALVSTGTLNAQELRSAPVAEPQYINSFLTVDANGKLIDLERQTVTFKTKMKVLPGYASVKMTTQFKPGLSSVRLPATAQFIVRGRTVIDPVSRFELRALKGSKDHREFVMTQGHLVVRRRQTHRKEQYRFGSRNTGLVLIASRLPNRLSLESTPWQCADSLPSFTALG